MLISSISTQMEPTQSDNIDLKMWTDLETFMQDFGSEDLNLDFVSTVDCPQDQFLVQHNFNQLKSEVYCYTPDTSLYDDQQLQLQQEQQLQSTLELDSIKSHLPLECDPFVASLLSDIDSSVIHVKEEHPTILSFESEDSQPPDVVLKVLKTSKQFGISSDPRQWSMLDIRKWATWVLDRSGLSSFGYVAESLSVTGSTLCQMRLDDFKHFAPGVGEALYIELELWKCAHHLLWSNTPTSSQEATSQQFITDNYCQLLQTSVPSHLSDTSTIPSIHTFPTFSGLSTTDNNNNRFSCSKVTTNHHIQQAIRPNTLAVQPAYFVGTDTHQQHLSTTNDPVLPQFSYFVSPSSSSYNSSPASNSSMLDFSYSNPLEVPGNSANPSPASSTPDFYDGMFGSQNDLSEKMYSDASVQPSRQGNQLWQFLKELLLQPCSYESCIKWLDRSKGIFKIEDSIKVAKLWGQRKNRPAMNYDKLSRSIRQYYKKGIIKKTSQSKRLVYQFCQKYA